MKKVCFLLIILMLAGSQGAWGAKTPPNIVGTWQGTAYWIWGETDEQTDDAAQLIIDRQDGPLFLGRFRCHSWEPGYAYYISGSVNHKGEILINGGRTLSWTETDSDITNFKIAAKLSHKQGVRTITGDWREIQFVVVPAGSCAYTGSLALTEIIP